MNPADLTWDPAAEQSVLGSILLSPACLPTVERSLRPLTGPSMKPCCPWSGRAALSTQ